MHMCVSSRIHLINFERLDGNDDPMNILKLFRGEKIFWAGCETKGNGNVICTLDLNKM